MRYLLREARCWRFMSRQLERTFGKVICWKNHSRTRPMSSSFRTFVCFVEVEGIQGFRRWLLWRVCRVCDLMGVHICYCEFKMQQGCLLFLRCMCSEKHRCSADSEVRVPSTESKTSFPAALQLILWDLQSRRGQRNWGHRTKTAGQPQAQAHLCSVFAGRKEHAEAEGCYLLVQKTIPATGLRIQTDAVTESLGREDARMQLGALRAWESENGAEGAAWRPPAHSLDRMMSCNWARETAGLPLPGTSQDHLDDWGPKPTLDTCAQSWEKKQEEKIAEILMPFNKLAI